MTVSWWTFALALAAGILSQGQLPGLPQAAPRSALVVGQVIDAGTGTPVSGALVEVRMQASLSLPASPFSQSAASNQLTRTPRVLTASDGRFVFRRLPKGSFMLTAMKPGYSEWCLWRRRPGGDSQTLVLFDGQKIGGLRIFLWRHSAISGVVVDEAGEPVVGIQMRALLERPWEANVGLAVWAPSGGRAIAVRIEFMDFFPAITSSLRFRRRFPSRLRQPRTSVAMAPCPPLSRR